MGKIFYPTSERLRFLLESIDNRELALPDFQRDFVWDPRATEELIESICQNFPAGSLLRIKNASGFYFVPREFEGAPPLDGGSPSYLILDGQQRLTSLYQALYGKGTHRYYINLRDLLEGHDLEDCVFYERRRDGERRYGRVEQQAAVLVFPFERLFGSGEGFEGWLDQILEAGPGTDAEKRTLKARLREQAKRWVQPVQEYEFPMVTLAEDTSAPAVCTIFETLNRTGVKLFVFDLLAARFWAEEVRLRDRWKEARDRHPILAEFEVDPYWLLQAVAIVAARGAPSCKRGDVLKMEVAQIQQGWDCVVEGFVEGLALLRHDCGVVVKEWLPYTTILIPLAAVLAATRGSKGPEVGASREKLERWFWCSVFSQAYENAPNTQAVKDYADLLRWIRGGEAPESVSGFSFDPTVLRQTTPRQRAVYRGVMALLLRHGARDLHTGQAITAEMILEKKIDDHHVFPQGWLRETGTAGDVTLRDCVLNRTLMDRTTNIRIGKKPPSLYLRDIRDAVGGATIEDILRSHLLPTGEGSTLWGDRFEEFLAEREESIRGEIETVTRGGHEA